MGKVSHSNELSISGRTTRSSMGNGPSFSMLQVNEGQIRKQK